MNSNKQEIKMQIRNPESDGVFSKQTQRELNSDHDQELHREGVCSDPKSLSTHTNQSPTALISKELKSSPQKHKRREREKLRT
jgi:hypothetical protein